MEEPDLGAHLRPQLRVEVRERLVHQKRLRLADDRPAHRHPLALTARELPRPALELLLELEQPADPLHPLVDFPLRELAQPERKGEVVVDRLVRVEGVVLEDHRDIAVAWRQGVDDLVADPDLSAPLMISSPATIRSAVVLPHPDGPTKTINSPSAISRERSSTATVPSG